MLTDLISASPSVSRCLYQIHTVLQALTSDPHANMLMDPSTGHLQKNVTFLPWDGTSLSSIPLPNLSSSSCSHPSFPSRFHSNKLVYVNVMFDGFRGTSHLLHIRQHHCCLKTSENITLIQFNCIFGFCSQHYCVYKPQVHVVYIHNNLFSTVMCLFD